MSEAGPSRRPTVAVTPGGGLVGRTLDKYAIRSVAGCGRSPVYEAWDPDLKRAVAVKTVRLLPPGEHDPEAEERLARFRSEAEISGKLQHPAIVPVFDYGEAEGLAYLVMEFMPGGSLDAKLGGGKGLPLPETAAAMADVLAGLAHAHDQEVLHRDIKPSNVLLDARGRAKLADFGIAQLRGRRLTATGSMVGTPEYIPPEVLLDRPVDARSDVYSAGVMLYELLTGRCPFEGDLPAIMHQALHAAPVPPSRYRRGLPRSLEAVALRAIARRPQDRFPSAEAFAGALRAALQPQGFAWRRLAMATAAACVLALVGLGGRQVLCQGGNGPAGLCPAPPDPPPDPPPPPPPNGQTGGNSGSGAAEGHGDRPAAPALRRATAEALASLGCAFLWGDVAEDGRTLRLEGVARRDAAPRIREALAAAAPGALIDWRLATFDGPYCAVLDLLRPYAPRFGALPRGPVLAPADGRDRLAEGDRLVLRVAAPADFAAHLRLDYLQSDGSVLRMQPTTVYPGGLLAPGAEALWGDDRPGVEPASVQEPLGTDLIIALATPAPATATEAREDLTLVDYLGQLRAAIEVAQRRGDPVAAQALLLTVLPR